jgi:hypothetical protein
MWVNGRDMSELGLWVLTPAGWGSMARQDQPLEARGAGAFVDPRGARIPPREWSVDALLSADTLAAAQSQWDEIKLWLANTWLEVIIDPWLDRQLVCRFASADDRPVNAVMPGWPITLRFLAANPYFVAPIRESYGLLAGEEVRPVLGTAPSHFLLRLIGPATKPTLTYYDVNGRVRGVFELVNDLLTGEWFEFDSETHAVTRYTDVGAVADGAQFVASSVQLFTLDPQDGTPDEPPSLSLDSGSALIYVRKAWQ